jgi:hypothetical protein
MVQVAKFKEHIELAGKMTADEGVKAFFQHLLEEESEHEQKLQELMQRAKQIPAVVKPLQAVSPARDPGPASRTDGHYALRDTNELTVGSLLGQKQ